MKKHISISLLLPLAAVTLIAAGCASDPNKMGVTNPTQPGPTVGRAVGGVVGGVAGNTAGFVVGVGEGAAATAGNVFNPRTHVVRHWETVTTSDGRTVQVPVDILVDENGIPLSQPKPAPENKNSLSGKSKQP